jgi:Ribbon-helix-helix protein, copG family.
VKYKQDDERHGKKIQVYINKSEYDRIKKYAEKKGVTRSGITRGIIKDLNFGDSIVVSSTENITVYLNEEQFERVVKNSKRLKIPRSAIVREMIEKSDCGKGFKIRSSGE